MPTKGRTMFDNDHVNKIFRSRQHAYRYTRLHARAIPMPTISRRWLAIIFGTALFLLAILLPFDLFPHPPRPSRPQNTPVNTCPSRPPRTIYVPTQHDRFDWSKLPTKHAVQNLAQLPNADPHRLAQIQYQFQQPSASELSMRNSRRDQVRETFQHCWKSYREKAWKQDELAPISGTSKNTFGGWGATLVDSLDTLYIMELYDEFEDAVSAAVDIDFGPQTSTLTLVNMFETTIRYLGGYLAAYDMTSCRDKRLLDKAVEVGNMIYVSYDTPNRMPVTRWDPKRAASGEGEEQGAADNAIIAEFASSSLEFTRLSQITGDMRWFDAGQRMTDAMDNQQNRTKLPGMWPIGISSMVPDLTRGNSFSFGAMSDSAYEYLPKMFALLGGAGPAQQYAKLTNTFMDVAMEHMFYRPMVPDDADILVPGTLSVDATTQEKNLNTGAQHLACFSGGMFLLAGKLFGRDDQIDVGRKVTNGCVWGYKNSRLGIMPEIFHMHPCKDKTNCHWNHDVWAANAQAGRPEGFTSIDDPRYILRPEAIESVFYLYRITGDARLQDVAWDMFTAISNRTRTEFANAAVDDVTRDEAPKSDSMESFWMGETLKYFYLIFSDPSLVSLDDYVFNTEAHPFRIPKL